MVDIKYSLDDIGIVPASTSIINSRNECNPYHGDMLPLFTSPMSSVVSLKNYKLFKENKINPIIPRNIYFGKRIELCSEVWCAFSLDEFDTIINMDTVIDEKIYVLIDIANGNMLKLRNLITKAKDKYKDKIVIMAGNIANPNTYESLSNAGADYVRLSIGSGSVCSTARNTGIFYPMASLISECFEASYRLDKPAKIIADGGIKGSADIIKSLALGADYVMCGSIFNVMLESAGKTYAEGDLDMKFPLNQYTDSIKSGFLNGNRFTKEYYGMSTEKAQLELGAKVLKTSEGIETSNYVEYTINGWVNEFTDFLKSAMSYTSAVDLYDFIGVVETIVISNNSSNRFSKY